MGAIIVESTRDHKHVVFNRIIDFSVRVDESSFDPSDFAKELQALQPTISVESTTPAAESTTPEGDGSRSGTCVCCIKEMTKHVKHLIISKDCYCLVRSLF